MSDLADTCGYCGDVKLTERNLNHALQVCPCCSSRWYVGTQRHWGSHNDWGNYLCDRSLSGWLRRLMWRRFGVVFNRRFERDVRHVF